MCVRTYSPRYPGMSNLKNGHISSVSFWMYVSMNVCVRCTHACMSGCMCVCTCSPRYPSIRKSKRDHISSASVCVCACIHAYMYLCMCMYVYTCIYVILHVCTHLLAQISRHQKVEERAHFHMFVCVDSCISVSMNVGACIHACMSVRRCVRTCSPRYIPASESRRGTTSRAHRFGCMHVRMCVCAYTCRYVGLYVCMHLLAQVSRHEKVEERPHLHMYVCVYIHMCR